MKLGTIIEHVDLGQLALPEFQRGYVWNRDQVRGLMSSLYRRHPVGGLLVWATKVDQSIIRGQGASPTIGVVDLLLDGQQRITSLYGIIRGQPPRFFDGNPSTFLGLMFNLADETFEFYAPVKMRDNPLWIGVTAIMQSQDVSELIEAHQDQLAEAGLKPFACINRLSKIQSIKEIDFHIEQISGDDKTIDVVVDIFNRVNSGGTSLSKGDLALARICAERPAARDEMKARLDKWQKSGYGFKLDWYLRCITAVTTGEAFFSSLGKIDSNQFAEGIKETERYIDILLNTIAGRLGLDHGDVLGSVYSLPLLARLLHQYDGKLPSSKEWDQILYWYIHTTLWGRYAGSTETALSQDLRLVSTLAGAMGRLQQQLRQNRGDLRVHPDDFLSWGRGARFYSLLYMMTRVQQAKDLDSGLELRALLLGHLMRLELHHIFPKAKLYKQGDYARPEVNSLANFMFLTQATNLQISDQDPERYFTFYEERNPGVLASQWIPMDPRLWRYDNYSEFLDERRNLLAAAANTFLDSLVAGTVSPEKQIGNILSSNRQLSGKEVLAASPSDEMAQLERVLNWVNDHHLPGGEMYYELANSDTGDQIAVFDLAWPDGLQTGLSRPVALLLDESHEVEKAANDAGFKYFTNVASFMRYVETEILLSQDAAD